MGGGELKTFPLTSWPQSISTCAHASFNVKNQTSNPKSPTVSSCSSLSRKEGRVSFHPSGKLPEEACHEASDGLSASRIPSVGIAGFPGSLAISQGPHLVRTLRMCQDASNAAVIPAVHPKGALLGQLG